MAELVMLGIYMSERTCYEGLRPSECGSTLLYHPKIISFYLRV
jgi:hypothetical protein